LREKLLRVEVAHHFLMREKNWWPEQCSFPMRGKTFVRKQLSLAAAAAVKPVPE